ncbi:MAG: hypothetical protein M5U28_54740 [Sandaracinaceae bacterium]|nr:hypothetical protein [Sandaracinaceae bacterium]
MRVHPSWAALASIAVWASSAAAQEADGAYGRLSGDLTLEAALGGGAAFEADRVLGAGTLELRARYLDVAGIFAGLELRAEGASRALLGVDLRPIFLARFLLNASLRDRYWDILLDSIGLDLGVAFLPLDEGAGAALAVGFGLDVPLVFFGEGYEGLSLRLAGRHVAALPTDRVAPTGGANDWLAMAALVVRGSVSTGLPAWAPRRYELPSGRDQ